MISNLKRIAAFAAAFVFASISAAGANDGYAALGAGGIVLMNSDDVRMASEDLFISEKIIRVSYVFVNDSKEPITARIAFPMPSEELYESGGIAGYRMYAGPGSAPLGFTVVVDGKSVTPEIERKAFFRGNDVTKALSDLGVPIDYPNGGLDQQLASLPKSTLDALIARGLASYMEADEYSAARYDFYWTVQHIYHWEQVFPVGRPLKIKHEYKPAAGAGYDMFYKPVADAAGFKERFKDYCVDDWIAKGVARRINAGVAKLPPGEPDQQSYMIGIGDVDYVLTTAATWKGPIGRFKLTIDKGDPRDVVSLCMGGFEKTGPTTFTTWRRNFEPAKDLKILFLSFR